MPTVAELTIDVDVDDRATRALTEIDNYLKKIAGTDAEATASLEDSEIKSGLREIEAALDKLRSEDVDIHAELESAQIKAELAEIEAMLSGLEEEADVSLDLETAEFQAKLAEARAALERLGDADPGIKLNINEALLRVTQLEAALKAIPDETVTVEVDADSDPLKNITSSASRASTQVSALAMGVMALGPALVPIGAAALGAFGALGGALTAAGAGAALFGAVAVTNFTKVGDAVTELNRLQDQYNQAITWKQKETALAKIKELMLSLTEPQRQMVIGVQNFQKAWESFAQKFEPTTFMLAAQGLQILTGLFPRVTPLMNAMGQASKELMVSLRQALNSPFIQEFGANLTAIAGPVFSNFTRAAGNVVLGIMGIINAFLPMSKGFSGGLLEMTQRFAEWGQGLANDPGFKTFMSYVQANMPKAIEFIKALVLAIKDVIVAVAPWGGVVLTAMTTVLTAISNISTAAPGLVSAGAAIAGIGAVFFNLLGPILSFISVFQRVAPVMATISAGPAGLVVDALVGIAAAFILAYNNSETFRNGVNNAVESARSSVQSALPQIESGFRGVAQWGRDAGEGLKSTFAPAVKTVSDYAATEWRKMGNWAQENRPLFETAWNNVSGVLKQIWQNTCDVGRGIWGGLKEFFRNSQGGFGDIARGAWQMVTNVISGALEMIRGVIQSVTGIFAGDWGKTWDGLVQITQGACTTIFGGLEGFVNMTLGVFEVLRQGAMSAFDMMWQGVANGSKNGCDSAVNVFNWLYDTLIGNSIIPDIVNGVTTAFNGMAQYLSTFMENPKSSVVNAWQSIKASIDEHTSSIRSSVSSGLSEISQDWGTKWESVKNYTNEKWQGIKSFISDGISNAKSTISSGSGQMSSSWRSFWTNMSGDTNRGSSSVINEFQRLGSQALSSIQSHTGSFLSAGQSLMQSLSSGISTGSSWVTSAVSRVMNAAKGYLPGSPAEVGPFSGHGYTLLRGQRMMANFADGIMSQIPTVTSAVSSAMGAASGRMSSAATMPSSGYGNVVNVSAGAVQVGVSAGADVSQARQAFADAGEELATQIRVALKRR